jgi:hypothetical protein
MFKHRTNGQRTTLDQPSPRPAGHPPDQTIRLGPEIGWRGGGPPCPPAGHSRILLSTFSTPLSRPPAAGPPCPLRWASNQRQPLDWTRQQRRGRESLRASRSAGRGCSNTVPMGREQTRTGQPPDRFMSHAIPHQQRPSERCPEGTFFQSPGFVRSTTLGCEDNPIGSSLKGMASGMPPR